jgi:hypothetical protein
VPAGGSLGLLPALRVIAADQVDHLKGHRAVLLGIYRDMPI